MNGRIPGAAPFILLLGNAALAQTAEGHRSSCCKDGEIHVTVLGTPEGKPLTTGPWEFKP